MILGNPVKALWHPDFETSEFVFFKFCKNKIIPLSSLRRQKTRDEQCETTLTYRP